MILDSSDFEKKEGLKFHIIAFLCQNSDLCHFAYITIIEWKIRHLTWKVAFRIGPDSKRDFPRKTISDDRNKYTKGRTGRRSKKRKGENQEHIPREPLLCWGVLLYDDASRLGSFFLVFSFSSMSRLRILCTSSLLLSSKIRIWFDPTRSHSFYNLNLIAYKATPRPTPRDLFEQKEMTSKNESNRSRFSGWKAVCLFSVTTPRYRIALVCEKGEIQSFLYSIGSRTIA